MAIQRDFSLVIQTSEISSAVGSDNIKRELRNAEPWLSDFCKDGKLLDQQYLEISTIRIIEFFLQVFKEEAKDIHDYASCVFQRIDSYSVEVIFRGYRFE